MAADLIDSLIGYVNDVKPYHTKIFGVEVEYVTEDSIDVEITEDFKMKIFMGLPANEMKQLGEWNRERWVPGIQGPRFDSDIDNTWDSSTWDEGTIGDPVSTNNPGVPIDRRNKAHEAIIRTLYGEVGWEALPLETSAYDKDISVDESYKNAILYPYPTGFMDVVYTKITETLDINMQVIGGDVDDIHNFTSPLWDAEQDGIDIIGTAPNVFYIKGNVETVLNRIPEFSIRPSEDMNVGWGTASLDQRTWDEFKGSYTVVNAIYDQEQDATVLRVLEEVPTVVAGSQVYGQILISLFDAGEWDGYQSTHVEQPDANLNASPEITECLEMVDGFMYDDTLAGGLDAVGWDEGTYILKGKSTLPRKHDGFDHSFFDTELWDAEPFFIRELFDAQGYDTGLLDSGSPVRFVTEDEIGVIVFSYDDVPRPSKYTSGSVGFSYSNTEEAKTNWIVNHNFGYNPIVRAYDNNNLPLEPLDVIHNSDMTLTVVFSSPTTGYLRIV
ncbi:MAG: hypothetical protein JXR12_01410 [Neptunomonas phycophila]|uniref:hypothetical protein n=1 Tax=Neptunomonas phycophila TaxID=1572645 RepID=UPI003B8CCB42